MPTKLTYGGVTIGVTAKVDPGVAVCLFRNEEGLKLGIPIEQGIPKRLGGLTGTLDAYGHEVALQTGDLVFESIVYFAKYPGVTRNLLDYDNLLYRNANDG